jgi:hypothetical protein
VKVTIPDKYPGYQRESYVDSRDPGIVQYDGTGPTLFSLGSAIYTQQSNKDWKAKVARRQDATSNYEMARFQYRPLGWFADSVSRVGNVAVVTAHATNRSVLGYNSINSADDSAIMDLALSRLKNKLNGNIEQVKLMVPVVELREMRDMIHASASMATDLVNALVKIKKTKGRSAFKYASDAWLNFSFGVRPFVSDMNNIADSISTYLNNKSGGFTKVVHGSATKQWISNETQGAVHLYGFDTLNLFEGLNTLSYRYVAGVNFNFLTANNYGISDQFGLNFESLPSSIWELIPYSWLIDYFTTVGAYLDDTFVLPPGSTIYVSLNKRYTLEGALRYNRIERPNDGIQARIANEGPPYKANQRPFFKYIYFSRTALSSIPHRSLRFKTADEIGKSAVNKLLNLTSLLAPNVNLDGKKPLPKGFDLKKYNRVRALSSIRF